VVATTSSIAIQVVVYLNEPSHVNGSREIFFACRPKFFAMRVDEDLMRGFIARRTTAETLRR
jgi:hypothetical protein